MRRKEKFHHCTLCVVWESGKNFGFMQKTKGLIRLAYKPQQKIRLAIQQVLHKNLSGPNLAYNQQVQQKVGSS